jgi:hypothetical protein
MARAKKESARSKPPTESSADMEELLRLHRAFKAAIRKCERARSEREQREAVHELGRLTGRSTKIAKKLRRQPGYGATILQITLEAMVKASKLTGGPVLSKFSRRVEAGKR